MSPRATMVVSASVLLLMVLVTSSCGDGTAPPPKPTKLVFVTAPPAIAETMVPLTTQPVVQTVDASGQAAGASTTVTVSVIGATGAIAASGTATTNATGLATFSGLTLGAIHGVVGSVTLQFAAPDLEPVTTSIDLRCALFPLTLGQTVNRSLTTGDCTFTNGDYLNMFALTTSQPVTAVRLTEDGTFSGMLLYKGPNGSVFFSGYYVTSGATSNNLSYKVLLPVGRTVLAVSSVQNVLGSFSLTTAAASEDLTCDSPVTMVASPITSAQQLAPGDCVQNSFLQDFIAFGLPANASFTASMSSSAFDPQIKLLNAITNALVTSSTAQGSTSVAFTNPASAAYYLVLTSSVAGVSGAYNLTLNITYPAGSAARGAFSLPPIDTRVFPTKGAATQLGGPFYPAWAQTRSD